MNTAGNLGERVMSRTHVNETVLVGLRSRWWMEKERKDVTVFWCRVEFQPSPRDPGLSLTWRIPWHLN